MNKKFAHALLIAIAATTFACRNDDAEQEKPTLFGDFFVRYLAPEQELKAYASFSQGDSVEISVPVELEGGVSFQGSGMEVKNLQGQQIRYVYQNQTTYAAPYTFKTTTPDGKVLEHTIDMTGIGKFSIREGVISKSKGMTLDIENGALKKDESIVLLFTNPVDNKSYSIIAQGPHPDGVQALPPNSIPDFPKGKIQLYLVKKQERLLETPIAGITASAEYYTDMIEVEVVD